jgi:hypothetical protein
MSQGQNSRSAGRHFLCGVRRIQPTLLLVENRTGISKLGHIFRILSVSMLNICTVNLAELWNVWSYTSAPPYVVTSRYLIKRTLNCPFCSALVRAQ